MSAKASIDVLDEYFQEAQRRKTLDALKTFEPWGEQAPFYYSQARYAFLGGANKAGKTYCSAAWVAQELRGLGDWPAPVDGWWVTTDYDTAGEAWIILQKFLPEWEIRRIEWESVDRIPRVITLKNGSRLSFKSVGARRARLQSANLHFVLVDEEIEEEIFEELQARLAQPGAKFRMSATWVKGVAWAKELFDGHKDPRHPYYIPGVEFYRLEIEDCPYATEEYKADRRALLQRDPDQYRVRAQGFFPEPSGLCYKHFRPEEHLCVRFPIPKHWRVVRGVDFGWSNPCAIIWIAYDPYGMVYLIGEYYQTEKTPAEIVKEALEYERAMGFPAPVATFMDPACEASDPQTGKTMQEQFALAGMAVLPAPRVREEDFIIWFNQLLMKRRGDTGRGVIQVFDDLTNWQIERSHFVWVEGKPGTNHPSKTENKMDHAMDGTRYALVPYMDAPPEPAVQERSPAQEVHRLKNLQRRARRRLA